MLSAVPYTKRLLIVGIAGFSTRAQDLTPKPSVSNTIFAPSSITITDHFESPIRASAVQLATRNINDQIDRKRDADAAEAAIDRLWKASVFSGHEK